MLQHREDAEDLVQGLFVDMIAKEKHDVDLPYLYRAITNRCINHMRSGTNRRRLLKEHDIALRGPVRTTCDEQVISMDLLLKLVERLKDDSAEVLILHYWDDLSQEEIAKITKTSRKTVGKRLSKVKSEVRSLAAQQQAGEVEEAMK
jgi:RNA polymerase sigma-70 factor, ECF subfamily